MTALSKALEPHPDLREARANRELLSDSSMEAMRTVGQHATGDGYKRSASGSGLRTPLPGHQSGRALARRV